MGVVAIWMIWEGEGEEGSGSGSWGVAWGGRRSAEEVDMLGGAGLVNVGETGGDSEDEDGRPLVVVVVGKWRGVEATSARLDIVAGIGLQPVWSEVTLVRAVT